MTENKPEIRFRNFSNSWEQRKLGDISSAFEYGLNAAAKEFDGKNKYIRITDIDDETRLFLQTDLTSPDVELENVEKYKLQEGDIVFARTGASVGKTYIYKVSDGLVYYAGFLIRARIKPEYSSDFVFYNTLRKEYEKFIYITSQRSGQPGVNAQEYATLEILVPKIEEQRKIGKYFQKFDNLITLHQRKYDKLLNIKKSMLEKMFPQNGADVPEIRFKGFTDAWEQRKVGEVCSISTGKSNTQDKIEDGYYPFYVRSPIIEKSNRYLYDEEAVLTVGDGVGTGKVFHYVNGKYDLHQRVYRMFDFSDEITAKYFYHYFSQRFYKRVMMMTAKTSVDSVRYEMISEMEIMLPSRLEQEKIADTLDNLDNLITLHQCKLKKLNNIKKSMLEKMFV